MTDEIRLEREDGLATITFDRPEKMNAFTLPMYERFGEIVDELDADDDVRCVVVQGAGDRAFCAGSDIGEFDNTRSGVEQAKEYARLSNGPIGKLFDCRHPTVAKIHGVCVGGGMEIASMCDVRICSSDSRFGIPINRIGLTVDYDELRALCDLVGRRTALEMLIEGRVFGAEEARAKNLVSRVVAPEDLDSEVAAAVDRILRAAPLSNRWHKAFVRRLGDPAPLTQAERNAPFRCYETEDYVEGTRAFAEKRRPAFKGR